MERIKTGLLVKRQILCYCYQVWLGKWMEFSGSGSLTSDQAIPLSLFIWETKKKKPLDFRLVLAVHLEQLDCNYVLPSTGARPNSWKSLYQNVIKCKVGKVPWWHFSCQPVIIIDLQCRQSKSLINTPPKNFFLKQKTSNDRDSSEKAGKHKCIAKRRGGYTLWCRRVM